jgi:lysophospholipase L1-like esterase
MRDIGSLISTAARYYKGLAVLVLNTLLIFAVLELASRAAVIVRNTIQKPDIQLDARSKSSFYRSEKWAAQYWTEFARSRKTQYHAFTVWRRAPFKGETINIDEHGIRVTPGSDCRSNALKVFTFGGSPMWGTGSPDWSTIPAYLRAGLQAEYHRPVCVLNFGESGYVSTQSVVELILQLQSGNVPDIAVFTDGSNDIYTAYQSGRSGIHENLAQIAARFEGTDRQPLPARILESSSLYGLISGQLQRLAPAPTPRLLTYATAGINRDELSREVVHTFLSNYEIVDSLAQKFDFNYFFFWPPQISVGHKALTDEERNLLKAVDPSLEKLYSSVYDMMGSLIQRYQNFYSLTGIFDNEQGLLWLDDTHVTPVGNNLIAEKMLEIIRPKVKIPVSDRSSSSNAY